MKVKDGVQVQVTYSTAIFRTGFTLPEGIMGVRLDRSSFAAEDEPSVYVLEVHVEAPTPEEAKQRLLAFRQSVVDIVGHGLKTGENNWEEAS